MNNWIKCEDRLPVESGTYLCFVKDLEIRIRTFQPWITGTHMRWWCNGSETKKVTHWQPLPSKPE